MGIKKFIKNVKNYFKEEDVHVKKKRKSLIELLDKLNIKQKKLEKKLSKKQSAANKKDFQEDHAIILLQIKKANKILKKLK